MADLVAISVNVGDLNDTVNHKTDWVTYLYGGSGNDTLSLGGRSGTDSLSSIENLTGGYGSDTLIGSPGTGPLGWAVRPAF